MTTEGEERREKEREAGGREERWEGEGRGGREERGREWYKDIGG